MVVKHWRQDWRFEDTVTHDYQGHGVYERHNHREQDIRGCGPKRYTRLTIRLDMKQWESGITEQACLNGRAPKKKTTSRREFAVRSDYQALLGRHRITVTHNGWIQGRRLLKLALKTNNEQAETGAMLAKEAGISRYERITGYDFNAGDLYWEKTESFLA